jgi:tripartite-type tricarboxylate transporter receptor subunit TctC
MLRALRMGSAALGLLGLAGWAHAQDATNFPDKGVTLVVAFSPGGATDVLARQLSDPLGKVLGQPVVVDNRPGASGYIAWRHVASARPDGYTLLLAENALAINTALQTNRTFDPRKQLEPIATVATSPLVLAANSDLGVTTMQQLVQASKSRPDKMSFSSSGIGSVSHLTFEALAKAAGIEAVHVPFKGGGEAVAAVVGNHAQLTMGNVSTTKKLMDAGQLKGIVITDQQRSPVVPDIPTLKEAGVDSKVDLRFWWGIFGPNGIPPAIRAKLDKAIAATMADAEVRKRLEGLVVSPAYAPASDLKSKLETEITNWSAFIQEAGIKVE